MSTCRYDRDAKAYVMADGEPCKTDDYGDPTHHCQARRTCSQHVGVGELACARCIGRTRSDLRAIDTLSALMMPQAISDGVDSEAAMLAGPAANVEAWTWRKVTARQGGSWHLSLHEEDDERHPYTVMTRWQMMLSEDWGHELPQTMTTWGAIAYLLRNLGRLAQDPEQDWPLFAREVRKVRSHMESVLHNDTRPERGAPCPECRADGHVVRLQRVYDHWCDDPDCCREHWADDAGDRWVCSRNRAHVWTHHAYTSYLEDRRGA